MHVTLVTAFPDFFNDFLSTSIIGRAHKAGLIRVDVVDLRSFGRGDYRQIDDYSFGAGGMVLMAEPLSRALDEIREKNSFRKPFVVYPTPQGVLLTQEIVETLFRQEHVVIICGHYEGLDERFVEQEVDLEVTIGDCVLTGGEIPAMTIIDAVSRLVPGVVGKGEAVTGDSFYKGMLDHPHYTRPASWKGFDVPEVLVSGNGAEIENWRRGQAVARTLTRRPDLLCRADIGGYMSGGFHIAVVCSSDSVLSVEAVSDLMRSCRNYGVARLLLVVADPGNRDAIRQVLNKTDIGDLSGVKLMPSLARVGDWIRKKETEPLFIGVSDIVRSGARHWLELKRLFLEKTSSVVFCFPWENELDEINLACCGTFMTPIQGGRCDNPCLPLRGKVAVTLDRFLGSK